ncbi:mid1-interacting protein 1-B-like [Limulus polyphemus]|uniref:Mid1-interacting protein 1-B-like n=1 Tax=Limulus polyphemus TaxID=6850 RepID=A0ABM1C2I1_LIMPO|nr:mid1-interacting protein 1-B-like [Limulus polyphemus]
MLHHLNDMRHRPTLKVQNYEPGKQVRQKRHQAVDDAFTCSQQSILSAMDRFVNSVTNMDSTVLVPSRLRDMEIDGGNVEKRPPPSLPKTDLFSFYCVLNDIKNELLWGPATSGTSLSSAVCGTVGQQSNQPTKLTRDVSEVSAAVCNGSCTSDSDSQADNEIDCVITDPNAHLATAYRYHLQGLQTILHQLADSADFLSSRYQEEVDASFLQSKF